MATKEDCQNLLESVQKDLRERGELDRETEQALNQVRDGLVNNLRDVVQSRELNSY